MVDSGQLERNKSILRKYIPEPAVHPIAVWIVTYDFKLKIKRSRASKYGDYRPPREGANHQITVNNDLNPYAFLITLVHEIAHLTTFNKHSNRPLPHGKEWKDEYKQLMEPFMREDIFPAELIQVLRNYMRNPAASSCSDPSLIRALAKYDKPKDTLLLEQLPEKSVFSTRDGRRFVKESRLRKRFRCRELDTNRLYLFNPFCEILLIFAPKQG